MLNHIVLILTARSAQATRRAACRVLVSVLLLASAMRRVNAQSGLRFVLTGNATGDEIGMTLGCTYTANPPYSNPADPNQGRLLDRDKPYADWNTTTGINYKDQDLVFDLTTPCHIDEVAMLFDRPQKPALVEVLVGNSPDGPWQPVGRMLKTEQQGNWWRLSTDEVSARYVRLFHKLDAWGWYLREVKIYGNVQAAEAKAGRTDAGRLVLVENGTPRAALIVADGANRRTLDAALAFQRIARRMTGVWMPIMAEAQYDGQATPVYLGDSAAVRELGIHVEQDASDGDHYVIRGGNGWLALVGNDAPEYGGRFLRGTVYAVYHLFETLGCGWYGPEPLWQVVPTTQLLAVSPIDREERPAFLWRHAWMHRMNDGNLRDAWREGGILRAGGHAYDRLVPPKRYREDHPEWYGKGQPDITHPEVIRVVVDTFRRKIDGVPAPVVVPFSLSSNDRGGFADTPWSRRVGNISSQQLFFANAIARQLNRTHPGRFRLYCLAYWHSHAPPDPMRKAEPGVHIVIVNEGNHTKALDMPESADIARSTGRNNTRERRAIEGWLETGGLDGIYEWYIPAIGNKAWRDLPWYPGQVTLRNLRYWRSKGIRFIFYESQAERNGGFPLRWPVYYRCYRGMWNPELTAREILAEACEKLYGPAASAMLNYYGVFEKAMLETDEHAGNWHLPSPDKVYTPDVEAEADRWLRHARESATDEPARQRIAAEAELWQKAKTVLATLREEKQAKTFDVVLNGKTMAWQKPTVTRAIIISLFGLPDHAVIEVVETDGQDRVLKDKADIDLTQGVVFRTAE